MYKYDTHVHTIGGSRCGKSTTEEQVRAYHAAGYAGFVMTDHFIHGNTAVPRDLPWPERMQRYYDSYLQGKDAAAELDFDLLFGIEHAYGNGKEVLLYGIELDFLLANDDFPQLSIGEVIDRVHQYGGMVFHAHPFRNRPYINMSIPPYTDKLDGIEVFNFYNTPADNPPADELADRLGLRKLSGSDEHLCTGIGVGKAGILVESRMHNNQELLKTLRAGDYSLIIPTVE